MAKYSGKLGTTDKQLAIAAKFPPWADIKLRAMSSTSDYVRKAVIGQMFRDGLLSDEEVQQAIALGLLEG